MDNRLHASATVNVPKSPEEYMWIFPEGCFEYCPSRLKDNPYVIGPIPDFDEYTWNLDGQTQSGVGQVDDFLLDGLYGTLDLTLNNGLCDFSTDPLNISFGSGCDVDCELESKIEKVFRVEDGPYLNFGIYGYITNPYNYPISISLNSPNGIYIPSNISIPANGTYSFGSSNPIIFVPDAGFSGGMDVVTIEVSTNEGIICQDELQIDYPSIAGRPATVEVVAFPNPITSYTEVQYSFEGLDESDFKGATIQLYNLSGHLQTQRELKSMEGVERFEFAHLPMGKYVVVFSYQGESIAQKILIKK